MFGLPATTLNSKHAWDFLFCLSYKIAYIIYIVNGPYIFYLYQKICNHLLPNWYLNYLPLFLKYTFKLI